MDYHDRRAAARRRMLLWHALTLAAGWAGLGLALGAHRPWGWAIACLAVLGGALNAERLSREYARLPSRR